MLQGSVLLKTITVTIIDTFSPLLILTCYLKLKLNVSLYIAKIYVLLESTSTYIGTFLLLDAAVYKLCYLIIIIIQ